MSEKNENKKEPVLSPLQMKDLQKAPEGDLFLSQEQIDEILRMSGAEGCIIILTDSKMPCPDALSGKGCTKPHRINVFGKGIEQSYAATFVGLLQQIMKIIPPTLY